MKRKSSSRLIYLNPIFCSFNRYIRRQSFFDQRVQSSYSCFGRTLRFFLQGACAQWYPVILFTRCQRFRFNLQEKFNTNESQHLTTSNKGARRYVVLSAKVKPFDMSDKSSRTQKLTSISFNNVSGSTCSCTVT